MKYLFLIFHPLCAFATLSFVSAMDTQPEPTTYELSGLEVLNFLQIDPKRIDDSDQVTLQGGILNGLRPGKTLNIEKLTDLLQSNPSLQTLKLTPSKKRESHEKYIITKDVIETIFTHAPNLTDLDLQYNTLSYIGAEALFEHLKENKKIKILNLSHMDLGNNSNFSRAALDFENTQAPQNLPPEIGVGDMFEAIQEHLMDNKPILRPHLDGSVDRNNRDVSCLINCLTHNTTLKTLVLCNNDLKTTDFEKLLPTLNERSFKKQSHLRLDLRENLIDLEQPNPNTFEPKQAWSTSHFPNLINIISQRKPNSNEDNCVIS